MGEPSFEDLELTGCPIIVAMKGHSCSGKSTLGREIARSLRLLGYECSLLSYDQVFASIWKTLGPSPHDRELCDDISCRVLWRIASTDLSVVMTTETRPRAIVLDSPLSQQGHLHQVLKLREILNPAYCGEPWFLVVDCRPRDIIMWQQRSKSRASAATDEPSQWQGIQKEISQHKEYSMDNVLCITVDTTESGKSTQGQAAHVIHRMSSYYRNLVEPDPNLTIQDGGSIQRASWRHFSHNHSLFYNTEHAVDPNDEKTAIICTLCREFPSGPVYSCSHCGFYLHKSCAELPHAIQFGGQKFVLGPTSNEFVKSGECLVCYGTSGVLYSFDGNADHEDNYKWQIHPKCARLPHKLKHSCHEHHLELEIVYIVFTCGACGTYGNVAAYCCKQCNIHFHLMCTLYLEARVSHKRHWHPLVLCTIPRDETDEYYCEICATDRHPDLWVYYCRPCGYEAHISCVNPQIKPCNPDVLLPENRAEGKLSLLWRWPVYLPDVRNPILSKISGSQLLWEPVESKEEPDTNSGSKTELDPNQNSA